MNNHQLLGIVLVVLGVVLLVDHGSVAFLADILAVALLVVGILVMMRQLRAEPWVGITCLVLGVLLLLPIIPVVRAVVADLLWLIVVVVAVLLIVVGIKKITQTR